MLFEDTTGLTQVETTASANEDGTPASGWSIANDARSKVGTGSWSSSTNVLQITIRGYAIGTPPDAPTNLTATVGNGVVILGWTVGVANTSPIQKHQYCQKESATDT